MAMPALGIVSSGRGAPEPIWLAHAMRSTW